MKLAEITILLLVMPLFLLTTITAVKAAGEAIVTDADSVWHSGLFSASSDAINSTDAPTQNLIKYAFVSHADSVWNSDLTPPSADIIDSADTLEENLFKYAFISHADKVWHSGLISPSSDITDSTDAPSENLITWAFVSHADSIWNAELKESDWEGRQPPEKWSFAIITDLHIGRGYPDYDGQGFEDGYSGEDYYLTKRLKNVVKWINDNKNDIDCDGAKCPIQFLAVLGDIADSAEKSEFLKAKEILDKLNDPNNDGNTSDGIPYVPLFGNHDVWPYTNSNNATSALGERYFDQIFWDENETNTKLMKERLNFQRDKLHKNYKNFVFNYGKINFVGLDFNSRKPVPFGKGIGSDAVAWREECAVPVPSGTTCPYFIKKQEALDWLEKKLEEFEGEPVILFSHHPFVRDFTKAFSSSEINKIKMIIGNENVLANFAGHIHGFDKYEIEKLPGFEEVLFRNANDGNPPIDSTQVVTTEALMVGSNEKSEYLKQHDKGIIKIVKVLDENKIDYKINEGKYKPETKEGKEFIALNPSIDLEYSGEGTGCVFFKAHAFTKRDYSFIWDFGDGNFGLGDWESHCYSKVGKYKVVLIAKDEKTGQEEKITRKIKIKEEAIFPRVIKIREELKEKIELIWSSLGKKATEFGRTMEDTVLIQTKESDSIPIGAIIIHPEKASEDIDLNELMADVDIQKKKSILFMPEWPGVIERNKIIFIPK